MSKKGKLSKDTFDPETCQKYSKDELQEFAKKLGIPYSGTKEKICQRIEEELSDSPKSKKKSSSKKSESKKSSKTGSANADGASKSSKTGSAKADGASKSEKKPSSKKKDDSGDFDVTKCMKYTVAELKDYCKKCGIRVSGTKAELCDRLNEKFSCDLPKGDEVFDPKKCEGDKPGYSKYEL